MWPFITKASLIHLQNFKTFPLASSTWYIIWLRGGSDTLPDGYFHQLKNFWNQFNHWFEYDALIRQIDIILNFSHLPKSKLLPCTLSNYYLLLLGGVSDIVPGGLFADMNDFCNQRYHRLEYGA